VAYEAIVAVPGASLVLLHGVVVNRRVVYERWGAGQKDRILGSSAH
jgi:hypothetical protein